MPTHRHRHFVALPLALGALLVVFGTHSLLSGSFGVSADTVALTTQETANTVEVGPLLTVHLGPTTDARADRTGVFFALHKGEATVRARGYVKVDLGQGNVAYVLGGAASFLCGTSTTVVALSVPVVVETAKGRSLLAMGHQLILSSSAITRSVAPSEWVASHLETISSETVIVNDAENPNAQIAALFQGDSAATTEDFSLLEQKLVEVSGRSDFASLAALSLLASGRPIAKEAVPNFHTALRSSEDLRPSIALALVQIARALSKPLSEPFIALWSDELIRTASTDIALALDTLTFGADAAMRFRTLGYPISADEWEKAVERSSSVLRSIAKSNEEQQRIAKVEDRMNAAKFPSLLASLEPPKNIEEQLAPTAPTLSSDELLSRTSRMLFDKGVLLTGDTSLAIDPKNHARVLITGFFHEEQGQLISYDASYDPVTDMLWLIRAGERLSNPVSSAQFFK